MTETEGQEISLARAAIKLEKGWSVAYRLILTGKLEGRQKDNGRWYVSIPSLERYLLRPKAAA